MIFDIAVIGAGHAGTEAALAAARLGMKTAVFTLNNDLVGNLPCNPSIGGTGKGHLVYEVNALGGEMGRAADSVMLQSRMLNSSKGPAVHSLRMQADREKYRQYIKNILETIPNLSLIQTEIVSLEVEESRVRGVRSAFGIFYEAKAVIIATGTNLGGRIIAGEESYISGPDNTLAALRLTQNLISRGIRIMRFKTGTPARVHSDSLDYSLMERQEGDEAARLFSSDEHGINKLPCHITYTNEKTHDIIRRNLHRSPLYSGEIKGTGPRYCPCIEDKVVRFSDKERHQIFVEPMGEHTKEMYLQGLSSSMPEEIQHEIIHSVRGLENAQIMRTAHAIEYDCSDPTQLNQTLEFKSISGLYGAGQFNGSSGYEEAAAQGLVAGINAALKIKGEPPLILTRGDSYIGTLIDDLVTKGTNEPYRMMTSRSEYRLYLRQDNAKTRLMEKGYKIGLVSQCEYDRFLADEEFIKTEIQRFSSQSLPLSKKLNSLLEGYGYPPLTGGIRKNELIKRPYISIYDIYILEGNEPPPEVLAQRIQTEIKYEGYIKKQEQEILHFKSLEKKLLPADIDYNKIMGLRIEAQQKLDKFRPESVGRASRISGISPADISVLLIYLSQRGKWE